MAAVVVSVTGVDDGTGFRVGISPSMYPRSPLAASN